MSVVKEYIRIGEINMRKKHILLAFLVMLLVCTQIFASGPKLGTNGATELLIPMGAVSSSLSGSNIAHVKGTEAIYWNPAGLANMNNGEATFSYMSYFADMKVTYLAAGIRAGSFGVLGISAQVLDIGDLHVTTWDAPEGTGEIINPNYMTVGLTYSKRFTDRILFGTNGKVVSERIGTMSASAVAMDIGLQYLTPFGVNFGVTLKNYGTEIQFDGEAIEFDSDIPWAGPTATTRKTKLDMGSAELPTSMNIGLSYEYKMNTFGSINISGVYNNSAFELDRVALGAEYNLLNKFFLRAGYLSYLYPDDWDSAKDMEYGLSYGMGLNLSMGGNDFSFDYGSRPMDTFESNQYFSISIGF